LDFLFIKNGNVLIMALRKVFVKVRTSAIYSGGQNAVGIASGFDPGTKLNEQTCL